MASVGVFVSVVAVGNSGSSVIVGDGVVIEVAVTTSGVFVGVGSGDGVIGLSVAGGVGVFVSVIVGDGVVIGVAVTTSGIFVGVGSGDGVDWLFPVIVNRPVRRSAEPKKAKTE